MTDALHGPGWTSTAANGCTAPGCGSQDTEWLDPTIGRRCADHWPPTEETRAVTTYPVGSFILVPAQGWAGTGIALGELLCGQPSRFTHAAVVVAEDGTIVEAESSGARLGNAAAYPHALVCDRPVQRELEQFDRGELRWAGSREWLEKHIRGEVEIQARALIGTPYSFVDYAAIGLLHLHLPYKRVLARVESTKHLQCAQLVDLAMHNAGIELFTDGRHPGEVMPADLAVYAEDGAA